MANDRIDYANKIENMLTDMPDFVTDFIYNFNHTDKITTMFEYCRDILDFLRYMVEFMPEHCEKKIKEITIDDMSDIMPMDINRYFTVLRGSSIKEPTIKRKRATLSSMYSFFVNNKKMNQNPVLATKTIKIPEKDVIYLTNDEQNILLNTVKTGNKLGDNALKYHNRYEKRDTAIFLLLLDTGLRVSEMLDTDIIDYDLENASVIVKRKGGDIQTVYYSDECVKCLDDYFDSKRSFCDKTSPAFTTLNGERLGVRAVEKLVKKYVTACLPDKAKIISPHKLRSSFAMSFYEASGNDILLLQKKLNHKSITTTNIYAKASLKDMSNSRNLLSEMRKK